MDSSSGKFPRGKARRSGRPSSSETGPQAQGSRPLTQGPRPQTQEPRPQTQGPRPQTQGPRPQTQGPRPQALKPQTVKTVTQVEQVTQGVLNLNIGAEESLLPLGIGRGAVRGRRMLTNDQFNVVRPVKSTEKGKKGSFGSPVKVTANYFPITSYTDWMLYQYRVDFNPPEDRFHVQKGLLGAHKTLLGPYIFDGTMLFGSKKYDCKTFELTSKKYDDGIVTITITFTSVLESNNYAHIQVFNLILRSCLRSLNLTLVGRNFYDANAAIKIPNQKITLWPGYETSIVFSDSGLLWRNEISTKVMRDETVFDFFKECMRTSDQNRDWLTTFKASVIGATVLTRYNNALYRIDDVDEKSNTQSTFEIKDGSKMSYVNYYKQKWNITLKGGLQPMLVSKKQKAFKSQKKDEESLIYLVPELCSFTGFTDEMRNNFTTMKAVSEYTRVGPTDRINRYYNFYNRLKNTPEAMDSLKHWNLSLKPKLIDIDARALPSENMSSGSEVYTGGPDCDWARKVRALPMFKISGLQRWVVLCPFKVDPREFVKSLIKVAADMKFNIPQPELVPMSDTQGRSYSQQLEQIINERNPSFILCVVLSSRGDIYNLIKRKLCVDRAVPSQVVLAKNITKVNMSILTKIAIQINCKLGGAPWRVQIPLQKYMILGFDVCHDKQKRNISYGALIATMNDHQTSFFSCVQQHESGQELSSFFGASITKALHKYKEINGCYPIGIIVYRDGVGDGQLGFVYKNEVTVIKQTVKALCGDKPPSLAFIIVKKRIGSRFFVNDRSGFRNPAPGTIVDSVVTDPSMYDFYLVSQNVKFGTVSPTHYNIIEDTTNISADHIQRITYKLTHMYFNWSGTVSVPALCQLAHKLAFLTAQSLGTSPNVGLDELLFFL